MDTYDWNSKFTTEYIDQFGTKIMFDPLYKKGIGTMTTTRKDGFRIGGEYTLREDAGQLYLGWKTLEFLVRPNEKGFDLLVGETVEYSYTRIE